MEEWEAILDSYQDPPNVRSFIKVIKVAENVIKMDLAGFEIDRIIQTLLDEPICLLKTIRSKIADDAWTKPIGDSYKRLGEIVKKYPQNSEHWIDDIVQICEISLDPRTRVYALDCLCVCARRVALSATRYITAIQESSACRAPLAQLLGAICEYHPETVAGEAINIWRIYLNILDFNKNTDTVISAVFQGLLGLFKHFGMDLPVVELAKFYQKMSREYVKIAKCVPAIRSILQHHCILFRKEISKDLNFRHDLWSNPEFAQVLPNVYIYILREINITHFHDIIYHELLPRTLNCNASTKFAALRILNHMRSVYKSKINMLNHIDVNALEYELKNQLATDKAEAVLFCLEINLPYSEKLLRTAILFYKNIPSNKRTDIIVNTILLASTEIMNAMLNFLITESCQPNSLNTYLPLWKEILESNLPEKEHFFKFYMKNVIFVLEMFLEEDDEKLPEKLSSLLTLTSHVLTLTPPEDYTKNQCAIVSQNLGQLFVKCGVEIPIVQVLKGLGYHLVDDDYFRELFKMLPIDRCKNEGLLCEMSLALLHAPNSTKIDAVERMILALEVIFTRKDAEPNTLSIALKKLEYILANVKTVDFKVRNIIILVEKLRNRKDLVGKEARILQRDVTMFLGKYSNFDKNNKDLTDYSFVTELKNNITLDIPNTIERVTYKMDLCRHILLAIEEQHEETLQMMLTVVCAHSNISSKPYQQALGALLAACGRGVDHARVVDAAFLCQTDALDYIIEYLHNCSPGVRKMLCDVIEGVLLKDPRSTSDMMLKVTDRVIMLLSSTQLKSKQIGLDLSEALFSVLKQNNELTKLKLPLLTTLISSTNEIDSCLLLDKASNLLAEKIELFNLDILTSTINKILRNLVKREIKDPISAKYYKNLLKSAIGLIKVTCDAKNIEILRVVEDLFECCGSDVDNDKFLRVMAELGSQFDSLMSGELMEIKDGFLARLMFEGELNDEFQLENVLAFVCQFAKVLLRYNRKQLRTFLSNLTTNMEPKKAIYLKTQLSKVLSKCKKIININNLSMWSETLSLEEVTNNLERNIFVPDHFVSVKALRIMIEAYNLTEASVTLTFVYTFAQKWPRIILKMFSLGYVKHLTVELSFLTDLLSVALRFMSVTDLKSLLTDRNLKGVEFCIFFMNVFVEYFLKKPFVLLDDSLNDCAVILNEVVKLVVNKRIEAVYDNLLELIDNIWPIYEAQTDFDAKRNLLFDISFLDKKLNIQSNPMIWAKNIVFDKHGYNNKILLISVFPAGDEFSVIYRTYASLLPTRFSEMRQSYPLMLRAMIDTLSVNGDPTLLDILASLADGDSTTGWWDDAFISCMTSIAQSTSVYQVYKLLYKRLYEGLSTGICKRLLVPLIRYSSPTIVTNIASNHLKELLEKLKLKRPPSEHYTYRKYVADIVRTLHVFVAVLEKVPPQHIESPNSPLYRKISNEVTKPWHLPRELGKICYTLRGVITQQDEHLKDIVKDLQITAYNCLCACISLLKPNEKMYNMIFDLNTWEKIIDSDENYSIPMRIEWKTTSVTMPTSVRSHVSCGSSRTRLFLRTLSENPLLYDLIDDKEDEKIETLEITLPSSSAYNSHPCAATLTSLLVHVAELGLKQWPAIVNEALATATINVRWLLAQIICNIKEELKSYGDQLSIGLFTVLSDTSAELMGIKKFNGLHIDVVITLIYWGDIINNPDISHVNNCTELFIHTLVMMKDKKSIFRFLMDLFNKYIDCFDKYITISWNTFEAYIKDTNKSKCLVPILTKITKNKIHIPELLPTLLWKLSTKHKYQISKIAELIGLAIKCDQQSIWRVKKLLDTLRKSNINDYVNLIYYSKYCDEQHFRVIVDLAQKLPTSEKNKCIDIIHTYMCDHPDSDILQEIPSDLKILVEGKMGYKKFEEFFETRSTITQPPKKSRIETNSIILNTIRQNEKYFNSLLSKLGKEKNSKVLLKLCTEDMSVRFTECFYIAIYLPAIYTDNKATDLDLSGCLSDFFELLFHKLKNETQFKEKKLRDTPLNIDSRQFSKVLTKTKTYIGTLRSYSYNTTSRNVQKTNVNKLDVQIPIENILDTLVEFSKVSFEASMELLKQLFISIKIYEFNGLSSMGYMVYKIIEKYPVFLDFSRTLMDSFSNIDGVLVKMEELKLSSLGSDVEAVLKLLHEEIKLWELGPEQFILGNIIKNESQNVLMSDENASFSLEEMVSAFKKLSNWEDLTIRERQVRLEGLPLLWSDKDTIIHGLQQYTETTTWFGKMVSLYKNKKQDTSRWLVEAERPPRKAFETSAIIEAIRWYDDQQTKQYDVNINKNHCIIEWAARLMIRSAHLSQNTENSQNNVMSRSQELIWCKRAIEMELPKLALQCVKRNTVDLYDYETLPWLEQRVTALKLMGLKQNDTQILKKALDTAEKYTPLFQEKSSQESVIGMQSLILELSYKLNTLNTTNLDTIMSENEKQLTQVSQKSVTFEIKSRLTTFYSICMVFYNDLWNETKDAVTKNEYLKSMLPVLRNSIDFNLGMRDHFLSMLLNQVENFAEIDPDICSNLIEMIKHLLKTQPTLFHHLLKTKLQSHPTLKLCLDQEMSVKMYTKCLQLVADPDYMLHRYIHELDMAAIEKDPQSWKKFFLRMKDKIFENPYIGTDYQPLLKYKNKLYEIEDFDFSDITKKREVLNQIKIELAKSNPTNVLRLSQICPKLSKLGPDEVGLPELLGLKKDEIIVKFDEQVHVYTDSMMRPCVLTVLLSNGKKVRFVIKQVDMRRAAAAIAVSGMYPISHNGYNIIPLSEDCGIIQFLEDHVRLQELISKTFHLHKIPIVRQSTNEDELILATRQTSLSHFNQTCKKIPSYILRVGIEMKCVSVEDFIKKRNLYLASLCSMTVLSYLFGIGDRHLENILYNIHDGSLQIIDLDSVLQFGTSELVPARLTRNLLAVIDTKVLESRLQTKIKSIRDYSRFIIETIKFCFQCDDEEFQQKLPYIEGTINGTQLSNQITEDSLQKTNKKYKDKYIELLREVFENYEIKNQYAIEEQVSNLLLHCTEPRILSVIRSGWEPWL